jgi:predicted permease
LAALTSWRVTRQDVRDSLAATDRTGAPTGAVGVRRALVTTQVAMTVVLLAAASLLGRSFIRLLSVDPGYRTKNTVVVDLSVEAGDSVAMVRRVQFYRELIARLHTIPGVTAVGAANNMPLSMPNAADGTFLEVSSPDVAFKLEDLERAFQDHSRTGDAEFRVVNDEYFRAMHIPVVQGRVFDDRDRPDAVNVAVISASLAQMRWPHDSPIGKWIEFGNMDGDMKPFMIVGIVGDVREAGLDALPRPTFYANYLQRPTTTRQMNVVLAGDGDPTVIAASARSILRDLRPDVPPRIRTLESMVKSSVASRRFALLLVGAFGTAALLLSAFGLYGVIAYFVAQRTTEIRIRIALGARRGDIMALVVQEGAVLTALGLVIGICVALAASRALASLLYGVSASDPVAFATTLVLVALAGALASTVPAYRASRADATGALRTG